MQLSAGAVEAISVGQTVDQPVLKVLGSKVVPGGVGGQSRYRLLISDGVKTHSFCMLATQLNHLVESGELTTDSVIRVKKYLCSNVKDQRYIFIILDLDILGTDASTAPLPERAPFRQVTGNTSPISQNKPLSIPSTPPKSLNAPIAPSTPGTPNSGMARVFPIQSLNPYQNRWTIRARVSQKASIRTWNKNGREGKLFSFTLLDESGEIRVTAFNAEVDKFFDLIEVNKVFYVTRGTLKAANKQFNTTNNEYEMTLNSDAQIVPCDDPGDANDLPTAHFNFTPVDKLDTVSPGTFVDIVGVVHQTSELTTITAKASQRELRKRELGIVDSSGTLVSLTLWGDEAASFDSSSNPTIVVKAAKVSDFNGRSLSMVASSSLMINPIGVPEAIRVKGWYERDGKNMAFETFRGDMSGFSGGASGSGSSNTGLLAGWSLLSDLKESGVGTNDKPDFFSSKAIVTYLKKDNFMYQACPTDSCNKKVMDLGNGMYRCEKCSRDGPNYKWRMMLMVKIADMSGDQWVTCFQDSAEIILQATANDLGALKEAQNDAAIDRYFASATFTSFLFRLRAKVDNYKDEQRLRVVASEVKQLDSEDYCKRLIKAINEIALTLPADVRGF